MKITENLFLSISKVLGIRVTPENLRTNMNAVSSTGGISGYAKTEMIKELLIAFSELEDKLDELKRTQNKTTV